MVVLLLKASSYSRPLSKGVVWGVFPLSIAEEKRLFFPLLGVPPEVPMSPVSVGLQGSHFGQAAALFL